MNDRIRELVQQAGEYTNSVYVPPVRSKTPGKIWEDGHVGWHDLFNEKFAELIILESKCWIHKRVGPKTALDFLEHFGIEEPKEFEVWVCEKCGADRTKEPCQLAVEGKVVYGCPIIGVEE